MINITVQARNEVGGPNVTDFVTVFPSKYGEYSVVWYNNGILFE